MTVPIVDQMTKLRLKLIQKVTEAKKRKYTLKCYLDLYVCGVEYGPFCSFSATAFILHTPIPTSTSIEVGKRKEHDGRKSRVCPILK